LYKKTYTFFVNIVEMVTIYLCEYFSTVTQKTITERIMKDSYLFVIIKKYLFCDQLQQ